MANENSVSTQDYHLQKKKKKTKRENRKHTLAVRADVHRHGPCLLIKHPLEQGQNGSFFFE